MKRCAGIVVAVVVAGALAGCLEREMTITSEPEGALVFLSDTEIGRTPVTKQFTWYGDYDIILRKEGYQTLKTHAKIDPPPQEIPPLDLFCEIAPWTIRDQRYLHFKLEKMVEPTDQQLIDRAEAIKRQNLEPMRK